MESQKSEKSKFWDVADWMGEERRRTRQEIDKAVTIPLGPLENFLEAIMHWLYFFLFPQPIL